VAALQPRCPGEARPLLLTTSSSRGNGTRRPDSAIQALDAISVRSPATARPLDVGIALDELYGAGHGEGAGSRLDGAGPEPGQLGVREWLDELRDLFGERVAEQVVGRAAEQGRSQALLKLDPESVTPSAALLQELLSLKGRPAPGPAGPAAPAGRPRPLRPGPRADVEPAAGPTSVVVARPTRRPRGPLDLSRTVARSLRTLASARTARRATTRLGSGGGHVPAASAGRLNLEPVRVAVGQPEGLITAADHDPGGSRLVARFVEDMPFAAGAIHEDRAGPERCNLGVCHVGLTLLRS
jgi:hypothetical protein